MFLMRVLCFFSYVSYFFSHVSYLFLCYVLLSFPHVRKRRKILVSWNLLGKEKTRRKKVTPTQKLPDAFNHDDVGQKWLLFIWTDEEGLVPYFPSFSFEHRRKLFQFLCDI